MSYLPLFWVVERLVPAIQNSSKEYPMNKRLSIFGFLLMFLSGCVAQSAQAEPSGKDNGSAVQYQIVLGKSFNDRDVVNFFASNNCLAIAQFEICKEAGMSFWMDSNQTVGYVYLYSGNNEEGVQRYRGKLPYGLSFYDPMWLVEEKLKKLDTNRTGLPDEADSPDHIHYRTSYKRMNLDIIYNSPIEDPDAYIYAVLISK
jgi:hypothetical protein